jgi:hypothetical protein
LKKLVVGSAHEPALSPYFSYQDDLINRREFDDYMVHYKKLHPELTDRDLPRFEDMDHDRNGHINFREWEEYQIAYGMG